MSTIESEPVQRARGPMLQRRPATRLLLLGLAGLYLAWCLVIPPFAGSDEFDHAYRAAAAARGQWDIVPTDATRGTGAWLRVPRDIVKAAQPECQARIYTKDRDCVGTGQGDTRRIASGAGRYHPAFYAVIGWPARAFQGDAGLYVMRVVAIAISLLFIWGALSALGTWSRSSWGPVGVVVACSPVVMYSGAIVAPNGVEMTSALALWCALVGLAAAPREHLSRLLVLTAIAGATLCTLRPLGPLWCLLAAGAVLLGVPREPGRVAELLRRRSTWVAAALVAASAVQSAGWTLSKGALKVGSGAGLHLSVPHRMWISGRFEPLWTLQSIAAFPLRDQATHPLVYACYLILFVTLLVFGMRVAPRRLQLALGLTVLAALAVPYAATVSSYNSSVGAWQGRYGLPLSIGIVVLATVAMDRSGRTLRRPWWLVGGVLFVLAQTVSVVYTLGIELGMSPQVDSHTWLQPSYVLAGLLATAASVTIWWSTTGSPDARGVETVPPTAMAERLS